MMGAIRGLAAVALAASLVGTAACNRTDRTDAADPTLTTAPQTPEYETDEARTDSGITTAVQSRYYRDGAVRGRDIDVSTTNGVVTLRGTVPDEPSRQQAETIARGVEGVTQVENQLRVDATGPRTSEPGRAADRGATDTAKPDDDRVNASWLTTRIQAQYFTTTDVRGRNIDVTSNNDGVVTLRGNVENDQERRRAVEIAQNTDGATRVEDHLRVAGAVATTGRTDTDARPDDREETARLTQPDAWVTTKIQAKYFMDGDVRGREINVDTKDGMVTLNGVVRTEAEKSEAEQIARQTDGVARVMNNLKVGGEVSR